MVKTAWDKEEEGGEGCGVTADGREGIKMGHLHKENPKQRDWNVQRPCGRKELPSHALGEAITVKKCGER